MESLGLIQRDIGVQRIDQGRQRPAVVEQQQPPCRRQTRRDETPAADHRGQTIAAGMRLTPGDGVGPDRAGRSAPLAAIGGQAKSAASQRL